MTTLTYSATDNINYSDWEYLDAIGTTYESYFITGYKVHGQGVNIWQGNYLYLYSKTVEDSSAFVRYRYGFANDESTHRFSRAEQVYLARTNTDYTTRRVWLRGAGLALQIHVYSDGNAPFHIVGYTVFETSNAAP